MSYIDKGLVVEPKHDDPLDKAVAIILNLDEPRPHRPEGLTTLQTAAENYFFKQRHRFKGDGTP